MSAPRLALPRAGLLSVALFSFFFVLAACPALGAGEPSQQEQFEAQLAAGEFAPALATAKSLTDAAQRDAWLARLAVVQARVGGRDEAVYTLSAVADDLVRSRTIQETRDALRSPRTSGAAGGTMADFDTLIDLITNTVAPNTWDTVGGNAHVESFPNGVFVDPNGVLRRVITPVKNTGLEVARHDAARTSDNVDPRRRSALRKVSLTRLEKHVQLCLALGRRPDEDMLHLAGLEKIQYVLAYPETGDLVLVGPAGPWRTDDEGRDVSRHTGRPVLQLDDLVVLFRYLHSAPQGTFTCSIDPTQQGLARTKAFAEASSATPLKPGERTAWLKKVRDSMGRQTISVEGIDPRTRVARVLVEADYRMKLVGMGLEEGTVDVPSYLDLIQVAPGEAPPPLSVLRWWFTLRYTALTASQDRDAFEIKGPGVQVLSENEMLTQLGKRVHTGQSDATNQEFANRFTAHFDDLARKYPVYADLENIFDLALVAALVEQEKLAERVGWHMTCFGDSQQYAVALGPAPQAVESVINDRRVNGKHLLVGVSGGVLAEPWRFVRADAIRTDRDGRLKNGRTASAAGDLPLEAWWWD